MDAKSLQMLELPRVLEQLAAFTLFSASRELALGLVPATSSPAVAQLLAETSEARGLLQTHPELTVGGARDVRQTAQAAARSAVLQADELLEVKATLAAARELKRGLARLGARYPLLSASAQALPECPGVVEAITAALNEQGDMLDSAAPRLRTLRADLHSAHDRLLAKLQSIVSSARNAPYLQEPIITQRGDRYVIPLKANFKGRIRGLVHDQSTSGATLFIEPLAVVELANQWRALQSAVAAEERRILLELSALVGAQATAVRMLVQLLAELTLRWRRPGMRTRCMPARRSCKRGRLPARRRAAGCSCAAHAIRCCQHKAPSPSTPCRTPTRASSSSADPTPAAKPLRLKPLRCWR